MKPTTNVRRNHMSKLNLLEVSGLIGLALAQSGYAAAPRTCRQVLNLERDEACRVIQGLMKYNDSYSPWREPQDSSAPNYKIEYKNVRGATDVRFVGVETFEKRERIACEVSLCVYQ
jgi:hypothetical protein